jgi:hypothetical protein
MGSGTVTTAEYRGHNIAIHPSGKPDDALTDAFMILEPSANPMFTRTLYEHPREQIQTYGSEDEAKDAALRLAQAWLDEHLSRRAE